MKRLLVILLVGLVCVSCNNEEKENYIKEKEVKRVVLGSLTENGEVYCYKEKPFTGIEYSDYKNGQIEKEYDYKNGILFKI
jgi:antitoxin component YwqK of YwqJK toxin-antitoxin module